MKKRFSIIMMALAVGSTPFLATNKLEVNAQEISYDDPSLEYGAPITVRFIDIDGNEIAESIVLNGLLYDYYNSTPIDIEGFELILVPDNATGPFLDEPQEVIYTYQRIEGAPVTVHYIDTDGNEIAESTLLIGLYYDTYNSTPIEIDGYELIIIPDNATGPFTGEEQSVIYIYQKLETVLSAPVTVRYVDSESIDIAESVILTGELYNSYESTPPSIEGYELIAVPHNAMGQFTDEPQEVIYVYQKLDNNNIDDIEEPDGNGNPDDTEEPDNNGNTDESDEDDKFTVKPDVDVEDDEDIEVDTNNDDTIVNKTITSDKIEVTSSVKRNTSTSVNTGDTTNKRVILTLLLSSAILATIVGTKKFKARKK